MRKKRRHYTPEEKVAILKRHLVEQVPVSALCDEYHLQPKVFYTWQQQFFENGTAAFTQGKAPKRKEAKRIQQLEQKLQKKHEVLSELMEEQEKILLYLIGKLYAKEAEFITEEDVGNDELMSELGIPQGSVLPWLKDLKGIKKIKPVRRGRFVHHVISANMIEKILSSIKIK